MNPVRTRRCVRKIQPVERQPLANAGKAVVMGSVCLLFLRSVPKVRIPVYDNSTRILELAKKSQRTAFLPVSAERLFLWEQVWKGNM